MTILQIVPDLATGGAEKSTVEIAAALHTAGARALVASGGGRLVEALHAVDGEWLEFPAASKNPLRLAMNAFALQQIITREHVALVHARSRAPAWSALAATRLAGVPLVTTYHGAYSEAGSLKRAYNSVMVRGERVIANSRFTADLIASRYGTDPARVDIIHRGIDVAAYNPRNVGKRRLSALRASWGLGEGARVVLHAARLTGWKGQEISIEAMRRLRDSGLSGVVCVLAGDDQERGGYRARLENLIAAYGLGEMVRLVGHCADMPAAFSLADVAIVPSTRAEAFGRAAAEAQAAGCPVIASDLGATAETVLAPPRVEPARRTGWHVPPGDAKALANAIQSALDLAPAELRRIGARGRAHVAANFSLRGMQEKTLGVYDRLLGTDLAARFAAA